MRIYYVEIKLYAIQYALFLPLEAINIRTVPAINR